jgi:hypothetical protein
MRHGQNRLARIQDAGGQTVHGSQNFARGVRGDPAQRRDGQTVFNSGDSRAHAAGARLGTTTESLRSAFSGPRWSDTADQRAATAGEQASQETGIIRREQRTRPADRRDTQRNRR